MGQKRENLSKPTKATSLSGTPPTVSCTQICRRVQSLSRCPSGRKNLTNWKAQSTGEYEELKTKRSEVKELQQIRKCIDIVEKSRAAHRNRHTKPKTQKGGYFPDPPKNRLTGQIRPTLYHSCKPRGKKLHERADTIEAAPPWLVGQSRQIGPTQSSGRGRRMICHGVLRQKVFLSR